MQGKKAAFMWSIFHSLADTIEDNLLTKFDEIKYLFYVNLITGIFIFIYTFFNPIEISLFSFIAIIFYAIATIGGDFCYIKALKNLPIGLANLIDSGSVFLILLCDIAVGYITPRFIFFFLFLIYIISIYIFSKETNKMKEEITCKKIDLKQIFILITSTIFYAAVPYFLKIALKNGANESGVNFIYYIIAITFFFFLYKIHQKKHCIKKDDSKNRQFFIKNVLFIGFLFCLTSLLSVLAYKTAAPVVVMLLMKLQLFFVVIISVIRRTDKMNLKKTISLITGIICIILLTCLN